jgi:hypothetical protein
VASAAILVGSIVAGDRDHRQAACAVPCGLLQRGCGVWCQGLSLADYVAVTGTRGGAAVHVALYEAGWPCQVATRSLPPNLKSHFVHPRRASDSESRSREVRSALYSRSSRARDARRRMRGFEGWGRHLRGGPATAAKQHVALTHPANLREIRARIVRASSTGLRVHEGSRRGPRSPNVPGLEDAAIAEQRIEDAGEATGEGDDGDVFPAARGDAQGPGSQLFRLRRATTEDRDRGLNQQPVREWPALVIGPRRWVSPELYSRGTRPR